MLRPHGIRGEVKCRVVTDFPGERFKSGARLLVGLETRQLRSARVTGDVAYLRFEGIADRDAAEALRGLDVLVPRAQAVELPEGEFFWDQVIGLRVEDTSGTELGRVTDILETGANHVYVVHGSHPRELLVPAIKDVVKLIDPAAGRMVIDPLPGLLA